MAEQKVPPLRFPLPSGKGISGRDDSWFVGWETGHVPSFHTWVSESRLSVTKLCLRAVENLGQSVDPSYARAGLFFPRSLTHGLRHGYILAPLRG